MNLKKYSWLAALPLLFTACQDDMLVEKHSQQEIYTLTATMDGGANSRAQIVLNGTNTTKESFHWNEGDAFTLFQLADEQNELSSHQFDISSTYSDEAPSASADFSTSSAITAGRNYVAFYPYAEMSTSGAPLLINNELVNNTTASWIDYFKNNMFMMAEGTISKVNNMAFRQLCGIIRITYKNESKNDRTFDRIGVDGSWTGGGYYKLPDTKNFIGNNHHSGFFGLTFTEKATVKAGKTENFYILYLKNGITDGTAPMSKVIVDVDLKDKTTTMYSPTKKLPVFETGKCYWLNITDNGKELSWTNGSSGGDEEPEINLHQADVEDLQDLLDALAVNARQIDLNFVNDIVLTSPLTIQNRTNFYMGGHNITLASDYSSEDMDAVFDVSGRLYVKHGNFVGKDGDKLHDYYFKLSGENADLSLRGVELRTGTAIANAVFMDDDYLNLESQPVSETESIDCSITTSGNAIHWKAANEDSWSESRINGNITGNVLIETTYNTLNTYMIFQSGTINGDLDTKGIDNAVVSDYIKISNTVQIGTDFTGWDNAGLFVEDINISVSDEAGLRAAIEVPQIAEEFTNINLNGNITLTSPLNLNKPVRIFGSNYKMTVSESFNWRTSDAVFINNGNDSFGLVDVEFIGCNAEQADKYMVKSVDGRFYMTNASMTANGIEHGVYLDDSRINLFNDTYITVSGDGYALDFVTIDTYIQMLIHEMTGTVTGDIRFKANYVDSKNPNVIHLTSGTYNGDFIKEGTYADQIIVDIDSNVEIKGTGWYPEVSNFYEIQEYARNGQRTLLLTTPLTVTDKDSEDDNVVVNLYGATLLLSDSFDWSNTDAVITLSGTKEKMIDNGSIQCSTTTTGKYLVYSTSDFFTGGLTLIAKDQMNAVYVEDARFNMSGSSVDTEDGYALDIKASTTSCASAVVDKNSTVKGKVRFENNYPVMPGGDEEPSHLAVLGGLVKGNLTLTGTNTQGMEVIVREGGSIVGKGWPEMDGVSVPTGNATNSGTSGNNFGDGGEF